MFDPAACFDLHLVAGPAFAPVLAGGRFEPVGSTSDGGWLGIHVGELSRGNLDRARSKLAKTVIEFDAIGERNREEPRHRLWRSTQHSIAPRP